MDPKVQEACQRKPVPAKAIAGLLHRHGGVAEADPARLARLPWGARDGASQPQHTSRSSVHTFIESSDDVLSPSGRPVRPSQEHYMYHRRNRPLNNCARERAEDTPFEFHYLP